MLPNSVQTKYAFGDLHDQPSSEMELGRGREPLGWGVRIYYISRGSHISRQTSFMPHPYNNVDPSQETPFRASYVCDVPSDHDQKNKTVKAGHRPGHHRDTRPGHQRGHQCGHTNKATAWTQNRDTNMNQAEPTAGATKWSRSNRSRARRKSRPPKQRSQPRRHVTNDTNTEHDLPQ